MPDFRPISTAAPRPPEPPLTMAEAVRAKRVREGLSLRDAAAGSGVPPSTIRLVELGRPATMRTTTKVRIWLGLDEASAACGFPVAPGMLDDHARRFISLVIGNDWSPDACWNWGAGKSNRGYGAFSRDNKQVRAHRFAFEIATGRQPRQLVLHSCDNPSCVNPAHLSDGGHGENMRQMVERRRSLRAERHHSAKLDSATAAAILLLHKGSNYTTYELAELFGVHQATVAPICRGQAWLDAYAAAEKALAYLAELS